MLFSKKKKAPAPEPSGNPYLAARQEWLERYGDYISQAHNSRVITLVALLLCVLSITGNVIQATQFKVVPYVVAVDSLGNTHSAGAARNLRATDVPSAVMQAEVANYIRNWRGVTADADLQNRMLTRLVAFSSSQARTILQEWFAGNDPYKRAETVLVSADVTGLPQKVSDNAWRVEWLETVRDRSGKTLERIRFEATLTIGVVPPSTEEEILQNPFGIVVANVVFSRLLQQ
jgi:type IV secretion system protein VirB5